MRWGRLTYAVSINWPKPRSLEGANRLRRLQDILTNETDSDFVDALTAIVMQLIEEDAFVDALERPFFVQDICTRANEALSNR